MDVLKKQLLKSMIRLTVTENKPGKLTVYVSKLPELSKKCKDYDQYIIRAIKLLDGIERVDVNCEISKITVHYLAMVISAEKIYRWMTVIVNTIIDSLNFIEAYGNKQPDYVEKKIEELLKSKLKVFNQ